ncbi:MAG: hypothetical protein IT517_06415 [Burkholderiales bacterium]|nr:hypothetical protein [Burkholderiales bacterium]
MNRSISLCVSAIGLAAIAGGALAAPVRINFDTNANGGAVPNGAIVDALYATLGVTFSREGAACASTGTNVYASADQPAGFGSAPNVVTTCPPPAASDINNADYGVIRVVLARNATQVCIDMRPDGATHFGTLRAFDAGDSLVATASSSPGVTQQVCASGLGIRGARIAGGSSSAFARFDNLVVHFGGGPATQSYYDGFIAFAAPTCSSASGGSIGTGLRTAIWKTPGGGATSTRVDAVNGVVVAGPTDYAAAAGSGIQDFAAFGAAGLGPYPFTYTIQIATSVGGAVLSVSTAAVHCVADGAAGTSFWVGVAPPALENPQPASYQSGVGVTSGWSCVGPFVDVSFDGAARLRVPYGSGRADTAPVCGSWNTATGFGLLNNLNLLGTGAHSAQLFVNGQAFGAPVSFRVTAPAGEFLVGASKSTTATDFPTPGRTTTLIWQQSQQNFAIESVVP